eukprot:366211-Chlamydomonas_euryale.AAC.5
MTAQRSDSSSVSLATCGLNDSAAKRHQQCQFSHVWRNESVSSVVRVKGMRAHHIVDSSRSSAWLSPCGDVKKLAQLVAIHTVSLHTKLQSAHVNGWLGRQLLRVPCRAGAAAPGCGMTPSVPLG